MNLQVKKALGRFGLARSLVIGFPCPRICGTLIRAQYMQIWGGFITRGIYLYLLPLQMQVPHRDSRLIYYVVILVWPCQATIRALGEVGDPMLSTKCTGFKYVSVFSYDVKIYRQASCI